MQPLKITFVSNFINHHQLPFCNALNEREDVDFFFIQTEEMDEERVSMGWARDASLIPYVRFFYEKSQEEECRRLIRESDAVIFGWTDNDRIKDTVSERLASGKLCFRISERIYREGQWKFISPRGLISKYREHIRYKNKPVYLLCAGAYVASDFHLIGAYRDKMFRWGYFPETGEVSPDEIKGKWKDYQNTGIIRLCSAGRLIKLKHAEFSIRLAAELNKRKIPFVLDIIGDGPEKKGLEDLTFELGLALGSQVVFHGSKSPEEVRAFMKKAHVFLFASNYLEGWGAVVNEAMYNGCVLVASNEAGAVPFLIEDGKNGISYRKGNYRDFEKKAIKLCKDIQADPSKGEELGINAHRTIDECWNARNAELQLVRFIRSFLKGEEPIIQEKGPFSRAEIIRPAGIIRAMQEDNHLE